MAPIMPSVAFLAVVTLASYTVVADDGDDDLVKFPLPGWPETSSLPSRWFSGLLDAGTKDGRSVRHHYVLVESETNPDKDPVLVWSNGGPGASSMFGLMFELGPLRLTDDGTTLVRNPWTWSRSASLLVLNGPPPVGFSYCDPPGPAGDFRSCGAWTDESTARYNANAVRSFLARHPRFAGHDWFFSGESYAGVYIPMLVRELMDGPEPRPRIRGLAIGNGCVGTEVLCWAPGDTWWTILFLRGHAQISERAWEEYERGCGPHPRDPSAKSSDEVCAKRAAELIRGVGPYFEYDLYSQCAARDWRLRGATCTDDAALARWISLPETRHALNVDVSSKFWSGDNGAGFDYRATERDLRPFYLRLARDHPEVRMLVYSGDTDVSVNTLATQNWTRSLGLRELEPWRPWAFDKGFVAGYVTRYEGRLDVVTIRGSGHFVPEFKPQCAYVLLSRFLQGKALGRIATS